VGRIAKSEEPQFARGFLIGEDRRRISQVAVKQVHVLKIDKLDNLSSYQEMKIKFMNMLCL
jgi:predicted XRE-type DNA-binding protein